VPELELRIINRSALPRALTKAEHYRLLNEPEQAESICLDVLAADPDNQAALVVLILALTDQFPTTGGAGFYRARECLDRLTDPYQRHYYEGLVFERRARASLSDRMGAALAYQSFVSAMACYDRAQALSPPDNDDAVLRWNACVRAIQRAKLEPPATEPEQPLE